MIASTYRISFPPQQIDYQTIFTLAKKATYNLNTVRSLAYVFPKIAQDWDYESNIGIFPNEVSFGSHDIYSWICSECGHEWNCSVNQRTSSANGGCRKCATRKNAAALTKKKSEEHSFKDWCVENDQTTLLSEWDYTLNKYSPSELSHGSPKEVRWICRKCGYRWPASLVSRRDGAGCKECAKKSRSEKLKKRAVRLGENDLESWCLTNNRLELLSEWDYQKNLFSPTEISYGSHDDVAWVCKNGHRWSVALKARTLGGNGCRYCPRRKTK